MKLNDVQNFHTALNFIPGQVISVISVTAHKSVLRVYNCRILVSLSSQQLPEKK